MVLEDKLKSDVQEQFLQYFREGDITKADNLKSRTGIDPIIDDKAREAIQQGYIKCFKSSWPADKATELADFTDVCPVINDEMKEAIQQGYVRCFVERFGDSYELQRLTDVEPTKEAMQQAYIECFRTGYHFYIDYVISLKEFLGVGPIIDDAAIKAIQQGQFECIKDGRTKDAVLFKELTGVELDKDAIIALCPPEYDRYLDIVRCRKELKVELKWA